MDQFYRLLIFLQVFEDKGNAWPYCCCSKFVHVAGCSWTTTVRVYCTRVQEALTSQLGSKTRRALCISSFLTLNAAMSHECGRAASLEFVFEVFVQLYREYGTLSSGVERGF